MSTPTVTICIPAWQAATFIARTLQCARSQTFDDIRILVSIDLGDDDTLAICRAAALEDPRIEVIAQENRIGWSGNCNALLDRVTTPFAFLYFHDDIIEPTYVEELLRPLERRPDALSAHCDMEKFGKRQITQIGTDFTGAPDVRLIKYLAEEKRGLILRCLMRREAIAAGLRFPNIAGDGQWRVPPFAMQLLALGPSVHVPRVLYRRWLRPGSMTTEWAPDSIEALLAGQRSCIALCDAIIDRLDAAPARKQIARFTLGVRMLSRTRSMELQRRFERPIEAGELSPSCAELHLPPALVTLDDGLQRDVRGAFANLLVQEAQLFAAHDDGEGALEKVDRALALAPHHKRALAEREALLRGHVQGTAGS